MTTPPPKDGKKKSCLAKNAILILTVCGVVCGVGLGIWMRSYEFTHDQIKSIAIPGEILMRMFTMIVIPLVVISLIVGTGNLDPKQMGKLGGSTLGFFLTSCFVAAVAGTVIASLVHPGDPTARIGAKTIDIVEENRDSELSDTILDLFRNVFTDNLFASTMYTTKTEYEYRTVNATDDHGAPYNKTVKVKHVERSAHMNILGLVVFSVTVGVLVGRLGDEGKPLLAVCNACDKVIAKMVLLIIWYSPIGILFLIMEKILQVDNLSQAAGMVGMYLVATYIGQLFVLVTNCIVYFVFTRRNPFKLLWGLGETLLMAIGTSSSTACLPVTFKCAEKNMKISHPICQLVLPIGATVHMPGTAMHIVVSVLFISQLNGAVLSISQLCIVALTGTIASVATPAVPSSSLFTMILVLRAINQPIEDISVIWSVDFLINRVRAANNIFADVVCASILDKYYGPKMASEEKAEDKEDGDTTMSIESGSCVENITKSTESLKTMYHERDTTGRSAEKSDPAWKSPTSPDSVCPNRSSREPITPVRHSTRSEKVAQPTAQQPTKVI